MVVLMGNIKERGGIVRQPTRLGGEKVILKWKINKKELDEVLKTPVINRLDKINSIQRKKRISIN